MSIFPPAGFEDARADATQKHLLHKLRATADPATLAALRLTASTAWRSATVDLEILSRLATEIGGTRPVDTMLSIVANNIGASYDNQPMQYSSSQSKSAVDQELIQAVMDLGGSAFEVREARLDREQKSSFAPEDQALDPLILLKCLQADQRRQNQQQRRGSNLDGKSGADQGFRLAFGHQFLQEHE